jgi:hypothetical protein
MTPHVRWVAEWSGLKKSNSRDVHTIIFAVIQLPSLTRTISLIA